MVIGLARSGIAAAEFLARRGARVVATDTKSEGELPGEALALRERGVRLELGGHRRETFTGATMVVVSPGVPWELPELEAARAAGVPVIAEIELAFRHLAGRVAAVTGTKGKSTTTAALGAMLREAGFDARVGGNIGAPLVGLVEGSTEATTFAVEVSSFQLEGTVRFHPHVAVWLNLSPDHLDRHPSLEAYVAAKARIFANQAPGDWAVVNADDPVVLEQARAARARKLLFRSTGEPLPSGDGAFFEGGLARLRLDGRQETLFRKRRGGPARRAPRSATCWSRRRRRGSWGPRRRRSRARCGRSAASSTCSSTWPRSAGSRTTTTRRPRTSRPRAAAWRPSPSRSSISRRALQGRGLRRARPGAADPRPSRAGHRRGARAREGGARGRGAGRPLRLAARGRRARPRRGAARRRRAARPGLLFLRHVRGLRGPRPRVQGRGAGDSRRRLRG